MNGKVLAGLLLSCAVSAGTLAQAETAREAELSARLLKLEEAVAELKGELAAARAAPAPTAVVEKPADKPAVLASAPVATPAAPAASASAPADGFRVGSSTIRLGGYFKANVLMSRFSDGDVASGSYGRDFYLPQTIPVGGAGASQRLDATAKQTRIALTTRTPVGDKALTGLLEIDFQTAPGTQGSQRTTNGYTPALRRAFITYGDLLVGQEWTTFQYVAALPETTDYIGPTEGSVFARQMQIRYSRRLGQGVALAMSLENPETATITSASPALVENGDDRLPDAAARLTVTRPFGEVSLAGIVRQLSVDDVAGNARDFGWGLSLAGKLPFGPERRHDLRFMLSGGEGIGRYLGLNFAPDAVYTGGELETVRVLAGFAALKLGWTAKLRSTFMASFQNVDYPDAVAPLTANGAAWSLAGNLFYSPAPGFDLGAEYRHGVRELLGGAQGSLDRLEFAAKYSF